MAYDDIRCEKMRNGVLITLDRPERLNALSEELRAELHQAFDRAAADPEVRAIVLTGAGRAFSAGADMGPRAGQAELAWPAGLPEGSSVGAFLDRWRTTDQVTIQRLQHMWELPKPVIGAIDGWCLGAGSWYALTTHITIASEQAVFGQPEVRHISNTNFILARGSQCLRSPLDSPATLVYTGHPAIAWPPPLGRGSGWG